MKRILPLLLATALSAPVLAEHDGEHEHHGRGHSTIQTDSTWQTECGNCHIAYPADLLPAASWRKLMSGLGQHFGSDASLSPDEQRRVTDYLMSHAGRGAAAPLRITQTAWFRHEHHEVGAQIWKRATVKSPANCPACHLEAAQGDFNEHGIHIPR